MSVDAKRQYVFLIIATLFFVGACKSSFNVDVTTDNHPLLNVQDDYTETKYPVVMVHGLYGFDDIFGMEYWHHIPRVLENGGTEVYVAEVSGANSPEVRGEQLITQLEQFSVISGSSRFHLFGHSLGGPTIRYAAAKRPDLVVSATSISGANHGSEAADNETVQLPLVKPIISFMGNALGHVIDTVSQNDFEQNILAATDAMSKEGIAAFNAEFPTALPAIYCNGAEATPATGFSHGVNSPYVENNPIDSYLDFEPYYSGVVEGPGVGDEGPYSLIYDGDGQPYDVYFFSFGGNKAATNSRDPLDGLHKSVSKLIEGDDDDGFVERCSTHHGYVVKDNFPMNHLDYMNWFLGLRDKDAPYAPSIFRAHVHYLKNFEIVEAL